MPSPLVAWTHGIIFANLDPIIPEPKTTPVSPVQRNFGASGYHHDQARFAILEWDMVESETEYYTLLQQFHLHEDEVAPVTIYLKSERLEWTVYNGLAHLPEANTDMRWDNFFPRKITMMITDLEIASA